MRCAPFLGLALLAAGVVGCGGGRLGGDGGPGTIGVGGSPEIADYAWGEVTVHVAPTSAVANSLLLVDVTDSADPPGGGDTLSFGTATRLNPNNGGYIAAGYGCASPALIEVDLYSCANQQRSESVAVTPGCLAVVLSQSGVVGEYADTDGTRCQITSARADITLPPPTWTEPTRLPPPEAAWGTIVLQCTRTDGIELMLGSQFVLPVQSWALLC